MFKKIAAGISKIFQGVKIAAPYVLQTAQAFPGIPGLPIFVDVFARSFQLLQDIDTTFYLLNGPSAKDGLAKLQVATPQIANIILQSGAFAGKEVENQVEFQAGCEDFINALVRIQNSMKAPVAP